MHISTHLEIGIISKQTNDTDSLSHSIHTQCHQIYILLLNFARISVALSKAFADFFSCCDSAHMSLNLSPVAL